MDLDAAIVISGDSKLRSVTFDGSLLTLHLENSDDVNIVVRTQVATLISDRSEFHVCHLHWDDLSELDTQHGIWVPPQDFGKLMQHTRKGRQLAFGRRSSTSSGLLCLVATGRFLPASAGSSQWVPVIQTLPWGNF
ncbi:MAG: hypothetical protein AB7K71_19655 [Polyangiaceae bacterium]